MKSVCNTFALGLAGALLFAGGAVAAQSDDTNHTAEQESARAAATAGTDLTIKTKSSPARHSHPDKGKRQKVNQIKPATPAPAATPTPSPGCGPTMPGDQTTSTC